MPDYSFLGTLCPHSCVQRSLGNLGVQEPHIDSRLCLAPFCPGFPEEIQAAGASRTQRRHSLVSKPAANPNALEMALIKIPPKDKCSFSLQASTSVIGLGTCIGPEDRPAEEPLQLSSVAHSSCVFNLSQDSLSFIFI